MKTFFLGVLATLLLLCLAVSASASPKSAPTSHLRVLKRISWAPPFALPSAATLRKYRIPFLPPMQSLSPAAKSIFLNVPAAMAISNQARAARPLL